MQTLDPYAVSPKEMQEASGAVPEAHVELLLVTISLGVVAAE